jgi:hypothetical protein
MDVLDTKPEIPNSLQFDNSKASFKEKTEKTTEILAGFYAVGVRRGGSLLYYHTGPTIAAAVRAKTAILNEPNSIAWLARRPIILI